MVDLLAIWTAVFFTLAIYSILYRDTAWYRIAESVYLGVAVGYGVSVDLLYVRNQWTTGGWSTPGVMLAGFAIAVIMGILWYFRFIKQYFYLYRWPLSIIVGTGIGLALRAVIFVQFRDMIVAQVRLNLWVPTNMLTTFNNILLFIMVPCVLLYFWFTGAKIRETAPMKVVDKIARYTMMAGFGSAFGYTILTRFSMFIGRAQFLLGITPNPPENRTAFIVLALLILGSMIVYDLFFKKKS